MSGDLSELSIIPYYLLPIRYIYLDYDVPPLTSTWKMTKDTTNHIPKNIIV